jgi:hypothetical protein
MLQDIATLTGGQVISEELGKRLDATTVADLGRARRVVDTDISEEATSLFTTGFNRAQLENDRAVLIRYKPAGSPPWMLFMRDVSTFVRDDRVPQPRWYLLYSPVGNPRQRSNLSAARRINSETVMPSTAPVITSPG